MSRDARNSGDLPLYATIRQAARILNIGEKRLRGAVSAGLIPSAAFGSWRRIRLADAICWVEGHFTDGDDLDRRWLRRAEHSGY